jgi:hypothetical protein
MKYISRNFQLKIMLNSKHILYTISSGINGDGFIVTIIQY